MGVSGLNSLVRKYYINLLRAHGYEVKEIRITNTEIWQRGGKSCGPFFICRSTSNEDLKVIVFNLLISLRCYLSTGYKQSFPLRTIEDLDRAFAEIEREDKTDPIAVTL
jgi:hypothetical protein